MITCKRFWLMMIFLTSICVGICACFVFDICQRLIKYATGIPPSNWALVGRWFWGVVLDRRFIAKGLVSQAPRPFETSLGWAVHYSVAIGYALIFAVLMEFRVFQPSIFDGLIFGIISVVVPWFFFMPALGNGILARHTPNPLLACSLAFVMHSVFGIAIGAGFMLLT